MAAGARRSRSDLAAGFTTWLAERDGFAGTVEVTRPQSGLSSETLFVEAVADGGACSLVVRLPPAGEPIFPDYDLTRQHRVQQALGSTAIPVAVPLALETDPRFVGAPFLVMPRLVGRTLTTSPPYPAAGWLHDADPATQARVVDDFARLLAGIHRLDPATLDVGALSGGGPTLDGMLDYWAAYLAWAATDSPDLPLYRAALERLRATVPEAAEPGLLWGDPQFVNLVYDDEARPVAVLDWEMAALGPAEVDLGWFLALHEGAAETAGQDLPGYPGRAAFVATYSAALGREVRDLEWYELFAHLRSGAIVVRIGELLGRAGVPNAWTSKVPQLRHIDRLLADRA